MDNEVAKKALEDLMAKMDGESSKKLSDQPAAVVITINAAGQPDVEEEAEEVDPTDGQDEEDLQTRLDRLK